MPIFQRHRASESRQRPILRVLSTNSPDETVGRTLPLRRGSNIVGRVAQADVVIKDATVSRQHACITVSNDHAQFSVQDNNSSNGTQLKDGPKVVDKPQPIAPGTIVIFGSTEVLLTYEGEQDASGLPRSSQKTSLSGFRRV